MATLKKSGKSGKEGKEGKEGSLDPFFYFELLKKEIK